MDKSYMEVFYKMYYDKWVNESDDRKLFCNVYTLMLEMIEDKKIVKGTCTKVAINNQLREEEKTLKEIIKRFTK